MKLPNCVKPFAGIFVVFFLLFLAELCFKDMNVSGHLGVTNMNEIFDTGVFIRDRLLFWRFSPGKIYEKTSPHYKGILRINSIGFREREVNRNKLAGTYRVFCLGGSNTTGEGLFEEERFSNILEREMNERFEFPRFEVYNFGMPGYSTLQMLRLLESELIYLNPDLVIVNPEQADGLSLSDSAPLSDSQIRILPYPLFSIMCFLEDNSAIYRLIKQRLLKASWNINSQGIAGGTGNPVRVSPEEHKANLLRMLKTAEENGIKMVFLTPLGIRSGKAINAYEGYGCQPSIDIIPLFEHWAEDDLFIDEGHINARGHSLVAESIAEHLIGVLY